MDTNPVIDWRKQPVEYWRNSTYLVCAYRDGNKIGLISIRRHDWKPCTDWRDKQEIKNQVVGPEWEAAELYPAESRVQDKGNWYWLWVKPKGGRYPWGFIESVVGRSDNPPKANEVQRPLAKRGDPNPLVQTDSLDRPLLATDLGLKDNTPLAVLEGAVIDTGLTRVIQVNWMQAEKTGNLVSQLRSMFPNIVAKAR